MSPHVSRRRKNGKNEKEAWMGKFSRPCFHASLRPPEIFKVSRFIVLPGEPDDAFALGVFPAHQESVEQPVERREEAAALVASIVAGLPLDEGFAQQRFLDRLYFGSVRVGSEREAVVDESVLHDGQDQRLVAARLAGGFHRRCRRPRSRSGR